MKFEVTVKASGTSVVIVEAENKDEATAQVKDMELDWDFWEWNQWHEDYSVREINDDEAEYF